MSNKKVIEKFASILNDFSQTKSDAVRIEASQFEELEHNFYWHLKHELGEKFILGLINQMCEESLSPELFEKWEEVREALASNSKQLIEPVEPIRLENLNIGDHFKYNPNFKGEFKVVSKEDPNWIGVVKIDSGRRAGSFPWTEVYPVKC